MNHYPETIGSGGLKEDPHGWITVAYDQLSTQDVRSVATPRSVCRGLLINGTRHLNDSTGNG